MSTISDKKQNSKIEEVHLQNNSLSHYFTVGSEELKDWEYFPKEDYTTENRGINMSNIKQSFEKQQK